LALSSHLPEERLWIHPSDANRLGLTADSRVRVSSRRGEISTGVRVTTDVPMGLVWLSFHFPEAPVNELTNDAGDQVTRTYEYKVCAVKVQPE
jgi:formate dehydrogenase alpha subunit